jgi:hypothetical protein
MRQRNPFSNGPGEDLILEASAVPTKNTSPNDTAALEEDAGLLQPHIRTKANFPGSNFHIELLESTPERRKAVRN